MAKSKRVTLAWELGEGLGHLPGLRIIASELRRHGFTPTFVLREPEPARALIDCEILAAPVFPAEPPRQRGDDSYATLLQANGFAKPESLTRRIDAWTQIFAATKPDLVVCDHAPGAVLAAYHKFPAAIIGNGFTVPPASANEFPIYEGKAHDGDVQSAILNAMREVFAASKRAAPAAITEPFRTEFRGVFTFPDLDPYRASRTERVLGPIEDLPPASPLPAAPHLFAYAASDYALAQEVTAALMDLGPRASAFFRGPANARTQVLRSRGVRVFDAAPPLADVLATATAVFSHAGAGLSTAALAAGRPQILAPRHLEAKLTAMALERLGVAVVLEIPERAKLLEAIRRAESDRTIQAAAQTQAQRAHAFASQARARETTIHALLGIAGA